jgi:hypothetical protein
MHVETRGLCPAELHGASIICLQLLALSCRHTRNNINKGIQRTKPSRRDVHMHVAKLVKEFGLQSIIVESIIFILLNAFHLGD